LYNNCAETNLTGWLLCALWVPTLVEMIAVCSLGAMLVEIIIVHSVAYAG